MERNNQENPSAQGATFWLRLVAKWQSFRESMNRKHRLVVMDSDSFKEKYSFELSGTNVFAVVGLGAILLVTLTALLIAFTPLRAIVPGYVNPEMVEQTYRNARTLDSLEHALAAQERMIGDMQALISGKPLAVDTAAASATRDKGTVVYRRSPADSALRAEVEQRNAKTKKK